MKKDITLKLVSTRYESDRTTANRPITADSESAEPQRIELMTEATLTDDGDEVRISYNEGEMSGMEGSVTTLIFHKSQPDTLTMYRSGIAGTTMVFSPGMRHNCVYNTPVMPFKMSLYTRTLINHLLDEGTLDIDYVTDLAGSGLARTFLQLTIYEEQK